jgi:hypothetical protein
MMSVGTRRIIEKEVLCNNVKVKTISLLAIRLNNEAARSTMKAIRGKLILCKRLLD